MSLFCKMVSNLSLQKGSILFSVSGISTEKASPFGLKAYRGP